MKNEAYGALTGFNKELASTADFFLPDVITPDFIQKGLNYYKRADEEQQKKVQESRGDSKLREIAGTIGGETLKNIPSAAMAILSGGASVGAQAAGKAVPSLLEGAQLAKTSNVVSRALNEVAATSGRNPMFWETFMRTVGPTYDNEIASGADPVRATMSAYANALLNAQIEIGGGIEKYDPSEVFWKAALRSAKEEGMEEVQQYAVENLVNKAIGSNRTKDKNGDFIETPWFSMDRGVNAVINPVDMAEQGFYGAAAGGLMSGGRTLGVNAVNDARNNNYRQAYPDFEEHAKDLIQRASVQGREGEMSTRAQNLAEEVSEQMARGQQPTAYQMRELESAVATDEYYNQKAYENSSQEKYNQAVEKGKADTVKQTGTADEYYGFRRGLNETEQRNYEKAKAVMGENASENSVLAVSKLMTGSESNRDIDTILLDPEARSAVEEIAEVKLPINNVKARAELENIALVNQIANRDKILEQTHKDIRTNMSKRGGELFDDNYDEAVKTLDVPNAAEIYENFFSRFYTAGTVEDADFEKTYNRIISPLVEDFGEDFGSKISQVFNHDFAQKVFAQGQIAMNSVRAKAQGRSLSVKASENPAGFTYEEEARKHISDREADLFTKLAERAKVHIRLVSSIAGGQANGSYDPETGVILIAADSDNKFITVFKHELTHHLKNTSPELYQKLEDFVFKKWYDGDPEKMEERVQEYQRRYGMRPDQAREEIIADASEAFFTDEGAINEAVTFNEKMARAIHDGIKSLLDTFLDLVDTDRRADKGYGDFLKDLDILRDAEKMWLEALNESVGKHKGSTESGAFVDNSTGENVQFSLRTEAPPKKTKKGYKVFVVKNGELYPPMVANPNGDPTPVGVWLNADEGVRAGTSKTGRPQVQAGGKGTQGGSGTLAYRPGWHLGEIPLAKQFMRQDANGNKTLFPKNFVWAECDIAADNDYQEEAMSYGYTENGKFRHAYAGLPKIPKDGFYQYRTNPNPDTVPWLITGAMKINRILSDAEVSDILAEKGIEAPKRQGGDKTLEELGIKYSLKEPNLGYHAGDLGKSTGDDYWGQGYYRGTGHFGFGTYFVGDKMQISKYGYEKRPVETVDFDKYNLFRPSDYEQGIRLHDALKTVDGYIGRYGKLKRLQDNWDERYYKTHGILNDLDDYVWSLGEDEEKPSPELKAKIDKYINEMPEYYRDKLDTEAEKQYDRDGGEYNLETEKYYVADDIIKDYISDLETDIGRVRRLNFELTMGLRFAKSEEQIENALRKTEEIVNAYPKNKRGLDSAATVFMKQLGYEGVDVSGIDGLDNTTYGSVIYDLKDEDLARKKEIGTARYSLKEMDDAYNKAVDSNDTATAERLVREAADRAGYKTEGFHGSLNASFTIFDKRKSTVAGNSGAGFYFSSNEEDSKLNYEDVEGADNQTKIDAFFDMLLEEGEWNGEKIEDADQAYAIAKRELSKKPGTYHVFLRYNDPYVRDYDNSTNIFDKIMDGFDESVVDRNDFDTDDDYQDALMQERDEYFYGQVDDAVRGAISDLEDFYDYVSIRTDIDAIVRHIAEDAFDYERLTWDDINEYLNDLGDIEIMSDNDADMGWGAPELSRAIIENFGYDAIEDKEAGTKFRQLEERGMSDTEHIIVFHPNQIKSADAITRDNDGNVIPLSQRFNPESKDIRFSIKEKNEIENIGGAVTEGGTVAKYSLKSWNETDKKKLLQNLTEAGFTDKEAKKWIKQVNSVAAIIYGDMARLDYEADEYQDALKPNSEYFYTLDLSTLCAKRRLYQGTYNAIMKRMPDRAMMPEDTIRLRRMMADMKHEVPCGICYEESRKKNEGKFADVWLNGQSDKDWNQKLKEYNKKLENYRKKLDQYNALENKGKKKPPKAPERPERWLGYANMEHEDPYIPTLADVTTTTGRKALRENHPEALEAYLEYQKGRGSANPKVSFTHTDYRGDIMRMTATDIENVKHIGGLRIQSFSDFETVHVIDMMQAVMDMASRKLTSQAYTKVPAFADIFGGTGIKINLSLIGMVKNGKLVFDSVEGIDPKEAFRLRKKYSKNVGTIIVGANAESILAAWKDPRIDMVIPFHRSGWSTEEFEQLGLGDYKDFQEYQTERYLDGSSPNGISLADAKMQEIYSEDYWDYNKTGKENAEAYLELCAKKHYRPVFYNFLHDNGDGTWSLQKDGSTDGYWKSLVDYKMYDNEGNGAPQTEVRPIFDMRAARKVMDKFDGDPNTLPIALDVVDRFVKEYKDTKYSLKSGGEPRNYQNTISKLENQVKDLKAEFKRTDLKTADPKDVRIQAGKLIKRHDSNMSVQNELVDTFNRIFRLYKENGTESFDDIYEIAKNAAVEVVNNISIVHDEGAEDYKAIKEYLKETPIVITEEMKKNITDFDDFRKRYFGKLKLVNGTTGNIDNVYMELNELFPGQFTEDYVNPADQLYHMADVLDNYAPYYETLDGASPEMQDYVVDIAADIMETAYGLQTKKTFADKKYEEKVKAVAKARQKALESRDNALNRQKQRYEKKIEDLKAHNQEMRANRKARREDSEARTKLLKIARRLDRFKTTAAKKEQIDALIGDLDLVAKGMTDKTLENLHDLRDWYSDKKETDPDFIADSNIEKKLERLSKKHIKDMDLADVRELYDVLSNIENELKTERKLINSEMKKDIKEAGRETIRNINNSKGLAMKTRGFDRFFVNGTLSPLRQIRRVTGYNDNDPLYIATKELADGQRKMLDYQMTSWKTFDRFMKNKDFIRSINGPKAKEIEVTGIKDGKQYKTKITPDIRMAMYLASMNADNLRHMGDGGVKLPDIKLYKKGRISEAMEKGTKVQFSPSMLNEITSHMTKTERAFAQEAYKYYNETSPKAINEVSEELKGYSLARVQNYYPIHTDPNFLSKEFEAMKFDGTIEGMGFLKERVRDSKPILMTGLVDELTRSIEMNSKYVGLAIPVRNFGKIYGVNDVTYTEREEGGVKTLEADYLGSVKDSISDKWGGAVASYIEKFMTDLQNGRKNYDDWGNFFSKLRSNYAGAVLTLNASVALKQAASYPTAAAVLGRAPLVKAMGNFGKVDLDLIAKYTPLQWYRSQGFSTTELGDIRSGNKQSLLNKYPFLNWIQGIDLATTRKLWKASEYYVQDHNKNLKKGTDEYYKAVADIYNRVIEETQPNYTTMQRPGLLRSDNDIVLALNMFKTQPYQNFNILYDSIGNYVAKRNQYNKVKNADTKKALQDAGRDMRNAIDSQIMQLAVFAAMTSLWALFRRKDDKYRDKEGNLTFVSYLERLAKDMLANSFAVVPFGSDIYGTVSSSITGEYYYGFSSVTDSSITDLLDAFTKGYKTIGEWVQYAMNDDPEKGEPDSDMYKDIVGVSESASRFLGAPFSNLKNLVTGVYGWVAISKDGEYVGSYEALKMSFAKDTEKKELLMKAYRNDSKAYEELRKMMIEDGFKEDSLDYYIRKQSRENPDESSQTRYQEMVTYLEGSPMLWTNNDSSYKEAYDKVLRDIALGIETSTTESYTKYEGIGLKPEELVLVKLAMEKADQMYGNKNGYLDTNEKEKGLDMLTHLHLTQKEKEAIKKIKFNFDKKG